MMNDEVIEVLFGNVKADIEKICLPHAIEQGVTDFEDNEEAVLEEGLFGRTPAENALEQDVDHFEDKDETLTQESLRGSNARKKAKRRKSSS